MPDHFKTLEQWKKYIATLTYAEAKEKYLHMMRNAGSAEWALIENDEPAGDDLGYCTMRKVVYGRLRELDPSHCLV